MSLYNLQEIFELKIKIGYYFDGPEDEKYRITKIINIDSENNFIKVLVVNESKKSNVFGEGCEGYYRVYQEEFIQVSKWYFGKKHRGKIKIKNF
ncbi:28738_t:CDS:2 [Dentiscutata erythropus]|uniref:28738_t:CDS:1 n=1 Tax=Dentiscutata erythropus TaxID=1348616 RepID=A0A9N9JUV9_9GLOM|nr:28738_t:CDS:2 [Dentiscutata erythropus]